MQHCIGLRRENKYPTERRTPLTPDQVGSLIAEHGIRVIVEPSEKRVHDDGAFAAVGAEISTDLSPCNIVFGIKEVPVPDLHPLQTFVFFSHTIKGQPHNMGMLRHMLDNGITLLDYELVTNHHGKRLLFFGNYAGYAGMINTLWAMGQRLEAEGLDSPLSEVRQAREYTSLVEAREAIKAMGQRIQSEGLPPSVVPLICGFTGRGQVSRGAQEIFNLLPVVRLEPRALEAFIQRGALDNRVVYAVEFYKNDVVAHWDKGAMFTRQEFANHPERFHGIFPHYLPYLSIVVNGIYWEPGFPKLITREDLAALYRSEERPRLRVIGDITCDIDGSIEMTVKATNSISPVFVYDPWDGAVSDGVEGRGPVMMTMDKLPAELPREASWFFGESLLPYVPALADADFGRDLIDIAIPVEFRKAVIALRGRLTPDFSYLVDYLEQAGAV